jgi:ParB/RepB/Spo0J family partition protein
MKPILQFVPLQAIRPSPTNPRKKFDTKKIASLAESIKANGVMQAILVRPTSGPCDHDFEVVDGHRRFLAAQVAGIDEIPAKVEDLSDAQCIEKQVIANAQREDLSPIEEAEAYAGLIKQLAYTPEMIGEKVGKGRTSIYNTLKLLSLCDEGKELVNTGELNRSIAEMIAQISSAKDQEIAIERVIRGHEHSPGPMSYRDAKQYLKNRFTNSLTHAIFEVEAQYGDLTPCTACPKNTSCNADLKAEHNNEEDHCTDSSCFEVKSERKREEVAAGLRDDGFEVFISFKCPAKCMSIDEHLSAFGYKTLKDLLPKKPKYHLEKHKWVNERALVFDIVNKKEAMELLAAHGVTPAAKDSNRSSSKSKADPSAPNFENTGRYINAMRRRVAKEILSKTPDVVAGQNNHLVLPTIIKAMLIGHVKTNSYDLDLWCESFVQDRLTEEKKYASKFTNEELCQTVDEKITFGAAYVPSLLVDCALHTGSFMNDDSEWDQEQPHLALLADLFEVPLQITEADRIVAESDVA